MILVFIAMAFILIRQIFELQIIQGENYISEFENRITKTRVLKSTRGNIYDRNGNLLAYNKLSYNVTLQDNGDYKRSNNRNRMLLELVRILNRHGENVEGDFFRGL